MAKFPYVASAGPLIKAIAHLRKSFPKEVTADTLRKLGVAPKNETYVINVLRFLGIVDEAGLKVAGKSKAFMQHEDKAFAAEFEKIVRESYDELFELHGDAAWTLDRGGLTQFFRTTDSSTDLVGGRQASTFAALAALSGHADVPTPKASTNTTRSASKTTGGATKTKVTARSANADAGGKTSTKTDDRGASPVGLTVRIEVNLPAAGDQETYDRIFRSIRENLINGNGA